MEKRMLNIDQVCRLCGDRVSLEVGIEDIKSWQNGELIQNAMPYLSSDEREILISERCGPCFDKASAEDEDMFGWR